RLASDNSSAFASLLGKCLPHTLSADESGGPCVKVEFKRIIVFPDGRREVEGVTPKQLTEPPAPDASGNRCRRCPLLGVKRTFIQLTLMSAFDPKRTWAEGW